MTRGDFFFLVPLRRSREKRSILSTLERTWARKLDKEKPRLGSWSVLTIRVEEEGKALRDHRANRTAEEAARKETKSLDKSEEN